MKAIFFAKKNLWKKDTAHCTGKLINTLKLILQLTKTSIVLTLLIEGVPGVQH